MPQTGTRRRLHSLTLAALTFSLVMACAPTDRTPAPVASEQISAPAPSVILKTIRHSQIGDRLTITAALRAVIDKNSFTIDDVDLPEQGLLVLGTLPDRAQPRDLLTVRGVVAAFDFEHFATIYGLDQQTLYQSFQGRKILLAQDVRSWS